MTKKNVSLQAPIMHAVEDFLSKLSDKTADAIKKWYPNMDGVVYVDNLELGHTPVLVRVIQRLEPGQNVELMFGAWNRVRNTIQTMAPFTAEAAWHTFWWPEETLIQSTVEALAFWAMREAGVFACLELSHGEANVSPNVHDIVQACIVDVHWRGTFPVYHALLWAREHVETYVLNYMKKWYPQENFSLVEREFQFADETFKRKALLRHTGDETVSWDYWFALQDTIDNNAAYYAEHMARAHVIPTIALEAFVFSLVVKHSAIEMIGLDPKDAELHKDVQALLETFTL